MVEVKISKTADELLQGVEGVLEEVYKIHPVTVEGYIKCGEYKLGHVMGYNQKLYDAIMRLGNFGKLMLKLVKSFYLNS